MVNKKSHFFAELYKRRKTKMKLFIFLSDSAADGASGWDMGKSSK